MAKGTSAEALSEEFLAFLETRVWSGFYSEEEILACALEALEEEWFDDTADDISEGALNDLIADRVKEKQEAERSWPAQTDNDRLTRAFEELTENGIIALENAGYTISDGWDDFRELADENTRGGCFYHGQDLERALEGLPLSIAFGATSGGDDSDVAVAREVVQVLEKHGFKPVWDGNPKERISLPLKWQRRNTS